MTHSLIWFELVTRNHFYSVFMRMLSEEEAEYVLMNGRAKKVRPVQLKLEGIGL